MDSRPEPTFKQGVTLSPALPWQVKIEIQHSAGYHVILIMVYDIKFRRIISNLRSMNCCMSDTNQY